MTFFFDVGSPVLLPAGAPRALHGPIMAELPDPAGAAELWDIVYALARTPVFDELERGRR